MPKHLPGFVPNHLGEIAPLMLISHSTESKNLISLKESNQQQERNKWQGQNGPRGPRVDTDCCCLPAESVELTVNSKKKQMAG